MNRRNLTIFLVVILLAYIGYKVYEYKQLLAIQPSRQSLITAELDRRLLAYRTKVFKNCNEDVMEAAKELADSIIFFKANSLMLIDSLGRPPKPEKPVSPESIPLKDSSEVKPLIMNAEKKSKMDTL